MPRDLDALIGEIIDEIELLSEGVEFGRVSVDDWQRQIAQTIYAAHFAAYMIGSDTTLIGDRTRESIGELVADQIDYLNQFADEIDRDGWKPAFAARAKMYAGSIKQSYWRGATFGLDLPYYPAEGTECLTNCGCEWQITWHDREELNATARWVRGKDDSCPTCKARARRRPFRFRNGKLV